MSKRAPGTFAPKPRYACECENDAHELCLGNTTPNGRLGHHFGCAVEELVSVRTVWGTFRVCPACAADCLAEWDLDARNPYIELPDNRLVVHIEWDSRAAEVWQSRHGQKTPTEVLYPGSTTDVGGTFEQASYYGPEDRHLAESSLGPDEQREETTHGYGLEPYGDER